MENRYLSYSTLTGIFLKGGDRWRQIGIIQFEEPSVGLRISEFPNFWISTKDDCGKLSFSELRILEIQKFGNSEIRGSRISEFPNFRISRTSILEKADSWKRKCRKFRNSEIRKFDFREFLNFRISEFPGSIILKNLIRRNRLLWKFRNSEIQKFAIPPTIATFQKNPNQRGIANVSIFHLKTRNIA